jgi:homoserine O-succinyltransferase
MLGAAAQGFRLNLCFYDVSGAPLASLDETVPSLWDVGVDGLIVTGTEPQTAHMNDEPSWPALANLVDWAAENTVSAVWSCLAAQAAVLRLDGLTRQPLGEKLSGVFACEKWSEHALTADAPESWLVPHSRYNGLAEDGLLAKGYQILSGASRVGPDLFVKPAGRSLFMMLQGHPEYGADCLLREYRRDIRRFLLGQRPSYPSLPEGYFDEAIARNLLRLREEILAQSKPDQLAYFDTLAAPPAQAAWFADGVRLYAAWLSYIAQAKSQRQALSEESHLFVS